VKKRDIDFGYRPITVIINEGKNMIIDELVPVRKK